jgi:hypothetical protein
MRAVGSHPSNIPYTLAITNSARIHEGAERDPLRVF